LPCAPPTSTLFPYTTLFRSRVTANSNQCPWFSLVKTEVIFLALEIPRSPRSMRGLRAGTWRTFLATAMALQATSSDNLSFFTARSEEHTSELQSPYDLVCRL